MWQACMLGGQEPMQAGGASQPLPGLQVFGSRQRSRLQAPIRWHPEAPLPLDKAKGGRPGP
jgi:hypothetical protein